MSSNLHRREFLRRSALTGVSLAGVGFWSSRAPAAAKSPNEKLNVAVIGTANQARYSIDNVKSENIVALCDIDESYLKTASKEFPQATTYHDFRKLFDQKDIDAVVVATPDHTHAVATAAALRLGKHVYCEKPLTHTVYEARIIADLAVKAKVATQMGTQIHAGANYRRVVEVIQSGAIGAVQEVHTWVNKSWGGGERIKEAEKIPPQIHWDFWLGPAHERPFNHAYLPQEWRRWWDFGGGTLADMACHHVDLPFWALKLQAPATVEAEGPPVNAETCPDGLIVRYEFPQRGNLPPLKLTWYDGNKAPKALHNINLPPSGGNMFVGEKGILVADYDRYKLFPEQNFAGFVPPQPSIPDSIGHHAEWLRACRTGEPTTCSFDYSGALTETVLLGNVAYRVGQKLEWDAAELKAKNCSAADKFLKTEYRSGWTL